MAKNNDTTPDDADDTEPERPGTLVSCTDPEPWPAPVDGANLLDELRRMIRKHIILSPDAAVAVALWVVFTYVIDVVDIAPMLAIESPTKRCGKTQLLILLKWLARRSVLASSITPAVTFRLIEAYQPTLLVDELDAQIKDNEPLRGILNSGHSRHGAIVIRNVMIDGEWQPREFTTWCPKALALIGTLPATLEDRSIVIRMQRKATTDQVQRIRADRVDVDVDRLQQQAMRWAADSLDRLRTADPEVPDMNDRQADNWRPLLAISDLVGGTWPKRARQAAVALSADLDEKDIGVDLLRDIRVILGRLPAISSARLVEKLTQMEERPWGTWRRGGPLNTHGLARLLQPFGIQSSGVIRFGARTQRGYRREVLAEAFRRYVGGSDP